MIPFCISVPDNLRVREKYTKVMGNRKNTYIVIMKGFGQLIESWVIRDKD